MSIGIAEQSRDRDRAAIALVVGAVVLTLATAFIHLTLGGPLWLLFRMNAVGYAVLAVALVVPIGLADRFRWLIRLALLGFVAGTGGCPCVTARAAGRRVWATAGRTLSVRRSLAWPDESAGSPHWRASP